MEKNQMDEEEKKTIEAVLTKLKEDFPRWSFISYIKGGK